MNDKQFVLGIGTGRCGTKSLAVLLDAQKDVTVYHELADRSTIRHYGDKILPWIPDYNKAILRLDSLRRIPGRVVGDVAFYYLNYIYFFKEHLPNLKIIVMEREKDKVVSSYIAKTPGRNHWCSYESECWKSGRYHEDRWDKAYPKIDYAKTKEEAIGIYWELYKKRVDALELEFKDDIIRINVNDLNKETTQEKLFNFIGLDNWKHICVHVNWILTRPS